MGRCTLEKVGRLCSSGPFLPSLPHACSVRGVSIETSYAVIFSDASLLKSIVFQRSDSAAVRSHSVTLMVL